ncbi:MAG TPA: caspase family protein [Cyclobacteriaceae bacterium]|nr:caspase family protein [Cyclobacteriaceae bacterium]HPW64506.1 caspase family protein [Cyclobacteriaceae bacterium]
MKMQTKIVLTLLLITGVLSTMQAQNVSSRSSEFEVDFSDPSNLVTTTVPVINWAIPIPETSYVQDAKFKIKFQVESSSPLKNVTISIKQTLETASRGSLAVQPKEGETLHTEIEKNLTLMDGDNVVEIIAENKEGVKTSSWRKIVVGATSLADASKLERTDYGLVFATDDYDNWSDLVNPVFDSRTIAEELQKVYKFKVEIVENATQAEILKKLREYGEKQYKPLDQLFIFFAGHGTYDQTFGEGFVVTKESMLNDEGKTTYLSHNRLRSIINNVPCEHIFLAMDVCFGGTFDAALASARGQDDEVYREQSQAEFLTRKLTYKTRKYLTSGGKTYVSDGIKGQHSPFAKSFLSALDSQGGKDGILTIQEIFSYVEKLKNPPRLGEFGDNAPGSDFLFLVK